MATGKAPARVLDGPYAQWASADDNCTLILQPVLSPTQASAAQTYSIRLGQPVYIDVTQFGPDNNVMNNGISPVTNYAQAEQEIGPLGELVLPSQAANAGPLFGVVTQVETTQGLTYSLNGGVPTWTNTSGKVLLVKLTVRQQGWGYVWVGTTSASNTICSVGSTLGVNSNFNFAVRINSPVIGQSIGVALATAINTTQCIGPVGLQSSRNQPLTAFSVPAPQGPGLVSIIPANLAGIITGAGLLIDTLQSGVQEAVSVASISYPAFTANLANAHTGNFPITGPISTQATGSMLISSVGASCVASGLVACWIDCR